MKVRKKPVEVKAWRVSELLTQAKDDWKSLPTEISEAYEIGKVMFMPDGVEVMTLEGSWVKGGLDHLIICGVQGELYPCDGSVFDDTYEILE